MGHDAQSLLQQPFFACFTDEGYAEAQGDVTYVQTFDVYLVHRDACRVGMQLVVARAEATLG
jgi:hypothetical protein